MTAGIETSKSFKKAFQRKSPKDQEAVKKCIERLAENPRHPGLNTHKMKGAGGRDKDGRKVEIWESYINDGNRVTFHYGSGGDLVLRMNCNHDILFKNP